MKLMYSCEGIPSQICVSSIKGKNIRFSIGPSNIIVNHPGSPFTPYPCLCLIIVLRCFDILFYGLKDIRVNAYTHSFLSELLRDVRLKYRLYREDVYLLPHF